MATTPEDAAKILEKAGFGVSIELTPETKQRIRDACLAVYADSKRERPRDRQRASWCLVKSSRCWSIYTRFAIAGR
jgi:hypothetical protein